ncbi:unnamed protein product [Camellia sinensis]
MASYISLKALAILALALAFCVQGIIGRGIECENLNKDSCAFAVSSSSKRCVLEKTVKRSGEEAYTCRASEIEADKLKDWIENDQCIEACGLDRTMLGISSDSLLESQFTHKLCSTQCYDNCVFLPKFCEAQGANARRGMAEIKSSGHVAPGPESEGDHPVKFMTAPPTMAPY